jgi:hypothetical protein
MPGEVAAALGFVVSDHVSDCSNDLGRGQGFSSCPAGGFFSKVGRSFDFFPRFPRCFERGGDQGRGDAVAIGVV